MRQTREFFQGELGPATTIPGSYLTVLSLWQVASCLPPAPSARKEEAMRQMKGEASSSTSQASEAASSFGNCPAPEPLPLAFQGCPAPTPALSLQVQPLHGLWEPIKTGVCMTALFLPCEKAWPTHRQLEVTSTPDDTVQSLLCLAF